MGNEGLELGLKPLPIRSIWYAVLAAVSAAIAAVTVWAAERSDSTSISKQTELVAQILDSAAETILHDQQSVSIWDDAVIKTRFAFDYGWIDENLGVWMHEYFAHDRSYIFDAADEAIYAMVDGVGIAANVRIEVPEPVVRVAERVRNEGGTVPEVTLVDGRAAIVSVVPLVPSSEMVAQEAGTEFLMASVRFLDESFVTHLSERYRLEGARFSWTPLLTSGEIAYPLGPRSAPVAYFVWSPSRPGSTMLREISPWILAAFAIFAVALHFLLGRTARSYVALAKGREQFRHQALHDAMTGLPNRAALHTVLDQRLGDTEGAEVVSLLLIDLDRFKNVNDALGHPAGDKVIVETSSRIRRVLGPGDEVFRLGGDEFAVLSALADERALESMASRLIEAIVQPLELAEGRVSVGASVGVAAKTTGKVSPTELIRHADIALYKAKAAGGNCHHLFTPELGRNAVERQMLEEDLRHAIVSGGLALAFQPTRSARTNAITGVEVLCRWPHPTRGEIPPSFFIPLAEESGLIVQLGEWVLRETCKSISRWPVPAAINVSAAELRHGDYPARLISILRETGIPIERIEIEVTESVIISEHDQSSRAIRVLRDMGFRIAIDDFGTGYSSLRYLRTAALHRVKIDRSFLDGIATSASARAVLRGIVDLAHAIGLRVTVEGVETPSQRTFLKRCGCDDLQGWLVGKPRSLVGIETELGLVDGRVAGHILHAVAG